MRLTEAHVARMALLVMPDAPRPPGEAATDEDYRQFVKDILAGSDGSGQVWVFAYGSLIWKPACAFVEIRTGLLRGWHRAFCLGWNTRFRGSEQNPGLMLALDRGGSCKGALYRLPPGKAEENIELLCRREMGSKPSPFPPRWVTVATEHGPVRAFTFCIDRNSGRYVSGLTEDQVAEVLSKAVGSRGSMVEYLFNTVSHLEEMGIHDPHLWRLQELVAERLDATG
ncbi:gamma-glutamylcyclotransferase [Devosia sp.]|uniref:gamma-glutamylcyclotransferase n=1 Tax=Devosia sp. TaxID=1871048 RepID=UPI00260DE4F5|nr:gamma-glutamylcyclotransferase [Devosia sp.]